MASRTKRGTVVKVFGVLPLALAVLFGPPFPGCSRGEEINWRKQLKYARYVVVAWNGSIERYQLSLLQDSLTGERVDDMINWRDRAKAALASLQGCPSQYVRPMELLMQLAELLGKQESLCAGKEYAMAHLEEWRSNKRQISLLHKELNGLLKN